VDHGGKVPVFISKVGSEASAAACLEGEVGARATKLCKVRACVALFFFSNCIGSGVGGWVGWLIRGVARLPHGVCGPVKGACG
jgi:hypothetical protein